MGETITFNHPVLSDINVDDVHTEQPVQISAQNGASTGWIVDSGTAFTFTPTDNALHYDTYTIHFSATDDNSANGSEGPLTCTLDITVEVLWQNECP